MYCRQYKSGGWRAVEWFGIEFGLYCSIEFVLPDHSRDMGKRAVRAAAVRSLEEGKADSALPFHLPTHLHAIPQPSCPQNHHQTLRSGYVFILNFVSRMVF